MTEQATDPPIDNSFQRALAYEMKQLQEDYAQSLESLGLPNWLHDILAYRNGWPVRFHPFPRLDRLYQIRRTWGDWRHYRIPTALEVLRGKHECN